MHSSIRKSDVRGDEGTEVGRARGSFDLYYGIGAMCEEVERIFLVLFLIPRTITTTKYYDYELKFFQWASLSLLVFFFILIYALHFWASTAGLKPAVEMGPLQSIIVAVHVPSRLDSGSGGGVGGADRYPIRLKAQKKCTQRGIEPYLTLSQPPSASRNRCLI